MSRVLTGDELGEAGESLFTHLCVQAGLTCNKSQRDRTGWDFVVEFPLSEAERAFALDERLPISCVVQLKSTAAAGSVRLSLSAVELLAKDPRPSFLVIFRMSPGGEGRVGHLVPMLDAPLRRVLHRLRTARAAGQTRINKQTISFDYHKLGSRFDLTPGGLSAALLAGCGSDRAAFAAEKQHQLENMGYEDGHLQADVLVWVESAEHLSDLVLGLRPVKPDGLRAFDVRFGIPLPYDGPAFDELEELRIEPPSAGPCVVAVRGADLSPAAVFDAEMAFALPRVVEDGPWLLVRHSDFTLKFGSGVVNFNSTDGFDTTPRQLSRWLNLSRALAHLASGKASIAITPGSAPDARITLPTSSPLEGPYLAQIPEWVHFLEGWARLAALAGVSATDEFVLADLWSARTAALAVDLLGDRLSRAWMAFDRESLSDATEPLDAIYINSATFAGAALSFAVKVKLELNPALPGEYRSVGFDALDVRPAVPDLQDYAEELAERLGIKIVINPANITEVDSLSGAPLPLA